MNAFRRWIQKQRIAVIYGGWSEESSISRRTGQAILNALRKLKLHAVGIEMDPTLPEKLLHHKISFCFIALHGKWGEDGTVQGLCDCLKIPYSGSGVLASALSMDKGISKMIFQQEGIPTPPFSIETKVSRPFPFPFVVKPMDSGSALGVSIVRKLRDLKLAFRTALRFSKRVLVEKFIRGPEVTAAILGKKVLPLIEIVPKNPFYDYVAKYEVGMSNHILPARLSKKAERRCIELALQAQEALQCRAFSRVDFIIDSSGNPWVLELNSIPGMTETSLFPEAAQAAGLSFPEMILEMIRLSIS